MTTATNATAQRSERDLFLIIDGTGGLIFSTAHGISKEHIEESSGQQDINHFQALQQEAIQELQERFGMIMPPEGPEYNYRGEYENTEPPPEGKQWYWPWYFQQKREWLQDEYDGVICSACPFSTGDIMEMSSHMPCSAVRGVIYKLTAPYMCGMVDYFSSESKNGFWTKNELIDKIREKSGDDAVQRFLAKEEELRKNGPVITSRNSSGQTVRV